MADAEHRLHLVAPAGEPRDAGGELGNDGERGDVFLVATIFAISFLPVASAVAHVGHWGSGTLGLGTAGSVLAGRELWASARAALRRRRRS